MDAYNTPFRKYFVPGGILIVLVVMSFFGWIREYIAFEKVELRALQRFQSYKIYEEPVYFPKDVKVAGPDGELTGILDGQHHVLLNIWATWCAPCVKELPALRRLQTILSVENQWRVMAVSIDSPESLDRVLAFTEKYRVKHIARYNDVHTQLQRAVQVKGLPMTLIINRRGRIVYEVYGDALWYESDIVSLLRHIDLAR